MTNTRSDVFSPAISYKQAMRGMRFILPLLVLITVALGLWDRSWDRRCFSWINGDIPGALPDALLPVWDAAMLALTHLGDTHAMLWLILLIGLPWWMAGGRKAPEKLTLYLAVFAVALVLATAISQSLKELVGALRPAGVLPAESLRILGKTLKYYSFPSGHTVTAFAGLCTLLPIVPASWRWAALALAAAIGISRIGMGAHWPVDVAAGALAGIVAAMLGWRVALWLRQKEPAGNSIWKKVYRSLALLGLFVMAANVAYTPFYESELRSIHLVLIGLGLTVALGTGYLRRSGAD